MPGEARLKKPFKNANAGASLAIICDNRRPFDGAVGNEARNYP